MSHEDTIRSLIEKYRQLDIYHLGEPDFPKAEAALDALVAERDEARDEENVWHDIATERAQQLDIFKAEIQRLRDALEHADVHLAKALGGGISFMTVKHDVDHARQVIAAALAREEDT